MTSLMQVQFKIRCIKQCQHFLIRTANKNSCNNNNSSNFKLQKTYNRNITYLECHIRVIQGKIGTNETISRITQFFFCTLDAGLLARSQYSEGPATGHLDTGFSWFPCVYKQMLRWFPTFQVATTCFSCSPPDLNLLVANFMFCLHVK